MTKQERADWLTAEVLLDYYRWRALEVPKGSGAGIRYRGMLTRSIKATGSVVAAIKQLLASRANGNKRDEVGAEYFVVNPRFRVLFTAAERKEAQARINRCENG